MMDQLPLLLVEVKASAPLVAMFLNAQAAFLLCRVAFTLPVTIRELGAQEMFPGPRAAVRHYQQRLDSAFGMGLLTLSVAIQGGVLSYQPPRPSMRTRLVAGAIVVAIFVLVNLIIRQMVHSKAKKIQQESKQLSEERRKRSR